MNTYAIVLLDMDGLFADSNPQISGNTKKLLNRLEAKHIPVVLCSALSPSSLEKVVRQIGLHSPIVCYGGSLIMDENRMAIADRGIDKDLAIRFKQYVDQNFPNITVSSWMYDVWLADSESNPYIPLFAQRNLCTPLVGALETAIAPMSHVHKLVCVGPPRQLSRLPEIAAGEFPELAFTRSGDISLDVLAKGISKCAAMQRLQTYYHVAAEQVVAIGDNLADLEMLRHAGLGIAMEDTSEAVKQAAARVTASWEKEGVYIALKRLRFDPPNGK